MMAIDSPWQNVGVLQDTPLSIPSRITGVMLCYVKGCYTAETVLKLLGSLIEKYGLGQ